MWCPGWVPVGWTGEPDSPRGDQDHTHITTTPADKQAVVKRGSAIPTASTGWLMAPEPCSDYGSHHTDNRMVVGWDL